MCSFGDMHACSLLCYMYMFGMLYDAYLTMTKVCIIINQV